MSEYLQITFLYTSHQHCYKTFPSVKKFLSCEETYKEYVFIDDLYESVITNLIEVIRNLYTE